MKCENHLHQLSKKVLKLNFSILNFFTCKFHEIFQNFLPKKPSLFPGINRVFSTLCNSTLIKELLQRKSHESFSLVEVSIKSNSFVKGADNSIA